VRLPIQDEADKIESPVVSAELLHRAYMLHQADPSECLGVSTSLSMVSLASELDLLKAKNANGYLFAQCLTVLLIYYAILPPTTDR
jgi:hypothetical protein